MTNVDRIAAIIGNHYRSGPTWDQDAAEEIAALLPTPDQVVVDREDVERVSAPSNIDHAGPMTESKKRLRAALDPGQGKVIG